MMNDFNFSRRAALALMSGALASAAAPAFAQDAEKPVVEEMSIGSPDAPVTMIEYASLTCPHCAHFHEDVLPKIRENYIDKGKVRLVFRPVYFDRLGLWADMMARCGGQLRYFGIVSMILDKQREWTQGHTGLDIVNNLYEIGKVAGLEQADMEACVQDAEMAQALVDDSTTNATNDKIEGAPTFVINGQLVNNQAYEGFAKILDGMLAE